MFDHAPEPLKKYWGMLLTEIQDFPPDIDPEFDTLVPLLTLFIWSDSSCAQITSYLYTDILHL